MGDDNTKILFTLLEKAEQILGIINLPDSVINKYNQLKELTYDKLNLEFQPLRVIKKHVKNNKNDETNINNNNNHIYEILNRVRLINNRKNLIIDFLFDLIEKFKILLLK